MTDHDSTSAGIDMPVPAVRERPAFGAPGLPVLGTALLGIACGIALLITGIAQLPGAGPAALLVTGLILLALSLVIMFGLTMVEPGEARVVQFLGRYTGTVRTDGLRWVNPLSTRKTVSTRIRNQETSTMKVNDADGNPIEIAAVVVWQVDDTARAVFEVDDFTTFVETQAETAVRHIATSYPYDGQGDGGLSLRDNAAEITGKLSTEVAERVEPAGVRVIESRFTHLAYAPEIAQAMLQRQQAGAVVAARTRIVEGAVGMVHLALDRLAERQVVELDEERKAAMVSNLLVVLCGDRSAQPVLNSGSLY